MRVTLINGPWFFPGELEYVSQNLGLAYLGAALRRDGHQITIIDGLALGVDRCRERKLKYQTVNQWGLPYREILDLIPDNTQFIGLTCPFTNNRIISQELAAAIRERFPKVLLGLGGVFPSTAPYDALFDTVDFVLRGEGEYALPRLLGGEDISAIPGFVFRRDGEIVDTGQAETKRNLDELPKPARDLLPTELYIERSARGLIGRRAATMITTRGCPYDCGFCSIHPISGHLWRVHSADRVLEEMEELYDRYGVNHIEFEDDNLTIDLKRARAILQGLIELRRKGKSITWEIPNGVRIDALDEAFIELCAESGNRRLYLPLEHGDPEQLERMDKRLDLADVERAVSWCRKHGVRTMIFVIVGYPGETKESFQKCWDYCRYLRALGADRFEAFIAKPYPGTPMHRLCVEEGYLVHPDLENVVFHMNYAGVKTPDFDPEEVLRRRRVLKADLNPWIHRWKDTARRMIPTPIYNRIRAFRETGAFAQ